MIAPLPREWARLHVLSPLLRSARALVPLAVVVGQRRITEGSGSSPWFELVAVAVAFVFGTVSWLVTRWRIHDGELQVETGLVRRQSLRVPLTRLQAVDVVRPLLARMLGLAEIRVVVAGHGSGRTRLAYLTEERASEVRAQLLALAHGLAGDTPEPAERPVLHVPGRLIVAANLLSPLAAWIAIGLVVGIALIAVHPAAGAGILASVFASTLALVLGAAHRIGAEWEFTLAEAPDGLRLRSGLLQTRAETIPYGRAQAVRWIQPLLWRPLGWVRLEIDVARRRDHDRAEGASAGTVRALLPVGSERQARWLLARVLPGATTDPPAGSVAPGRARLRAPWSRHYLRAWHDDRHVVCGTGRIRPAFVVVPLEKAQSVRWVQGPVSRALGLASVYVDTAGHRFPGRAECRDEGEARRWVETLPALARAARQRSEGSALNSDRTHSIADQPA